MNKDAYNEKLNALWNILKQQLSDRNAQRLVFLYEQKFGNPLSKILNTMQMINEKYEGKAAIITTGFPIMKTLSAETDGPLGSLILAMILNKIGYKIIFVSGEITLPLVKELSEIIPLRDIRFYKCTSSDVACITLGEEITKKFSPQIAIAVESPAPNEKNVYHNMYGQDISTICGHFGALFKTFNSYDIFQVGIGDGGNEIGMGLLKDELKSIIKYGDVCQCPCKGGIISNVATDHLIPAQTSNIGAYILAASLIIFFNLDIVLDISLIEQMLEKAMDLNAIDGILMKVSKSVDGIPFDRIKKVLLEINYILKKD